MSESFEQASKLEAHSQVDVSDGHGSDQTKMAMQPDNHSEVTALAHSRPHSAHVHEIPHHWTPGNAQPLCLFGFSAGIFLISSCGVNARDITINNILVGMLVFFSGCAQFIGGIIELLKGNTYGGTVFPSYGAFNLAYAMIFIPGSGIMDAYTDSKTGELVPQFDQAVAMFLWAWFIVTFIFCVGAIRSNWILFIDLVALDLVFMLLAIGNMNGNSNVSTAGSALGYVCALLTFVLGAEGLWASSTPIKVPVFPMTKHD